MKNTINICIGHLKFPQHFERHVDLMISPTLYDGASRLARVKDTIFGVNGSSLSEYAQLIWLYRNIDTIARNFEYIRIFQYRRFVSIHESSRGSKSSNNPWSAAISENDLLSFEKNFSRNSSQELFNTPVNCIGGVAAQYANAHALEDLLNFSVFLIEKNIFNQLKVCEFLKEDILIPACNIGVFKIDTFKSLLNIIEKAAEFLNFKQFKLREGYQRRNVGFLLERLNSFLILDRIRSGNSPPNFGHNVVISSDPHVLPTL